MTMLHFQKNNVLNNVASLSALNIAPVFVSSLKLKPVTKQIKERITELKELAIEDGIVISQASLELFNQFIKKTSPRLCPALFLLDEGIFQARWVNEDKELVSLRFFEDGLILFAIFIKKEDDFERFAEKKPLIDTIKQIIDMNAMRLIK